jgi:WD40-like Beta Propeller Repeat
LSDPEHPKPGKPEPFLRTPFNERDGVFSPDGRWIAYTSNESGTRELYVRPFPGPGGKWQISDGGALYPRWPASGRTLFYESPAADRIMAADYISTGDSFSASKPRVWASLQMMDASGTVNLDVAPDGKRFAVFPGAHEQMSITRPRRWKSLLTVSLFEGWRDSSRVVGHSEAIHLVSGHPAEAS